MADANLKYIVEILAEDGDAVQKLSKLGLTVDTAKAKCEQLKATFTQQEGELDKLGIRYDEVLNKIKSAHAHLNPTTNAITKQIAEIHHLEKQMGALESQHAEGSAAYKLLSDKLKKYNDTLIETAASSDSSLESYVGIGKQFRELKAEVEQSERAYGALKTAINEIENPTKKVEDSSGTLRTQLYNIRMEMARLVQQGKITSKEYEELSVRAKELRKQQALVNASMSDGTGMQIFIGTMRTAVGTISTAVGVMQALGISQEDAEKAERRFQSVLSAAVGLQEIANALKGDSIVMSGVYIIQKKAEARAQDLATAATGRGVVATKLLTAAQKVFNMVAAMNPYVLLALAITTVVGAIYALIKGTEKYANRSENTRKSIEKINKEFEKEEKYLKRIQDEHRRELELYSARGAAASKLHNMKMQQMRQEKKILGEQIGANKALLDAEKNRLLSTGELKYVNGKLVGKKEAVDGYNSLRESINSQVETYKDISNKLKVEDAQYTESVKEQQKKVNEAIYQAMAERIKIQDDYYATERKRLKDAYEKNLHDIEQEEKAWNKENPGVKNKSFDARRNTLEVGLNLDYKKLEDEFKEWKREFEKATAQIAVNVQLDVLNEQLKYETDITKQRQLRKEITEREIAAQKEQLSDELTKSLRDKYGRDKNGNYVADNIVKMYNEQDAGSRNAMRQSILSSGLTDIDITEATQTIDLYYARMKAVEKELLSSMRNELIAESSNNLVEYINAQTEALEWRNNEIAKLAAGESELSQEDIEKIYQKKVSKSTEQFAPTDVEDIEKMVEPVISAMASSSFDAILKQYNKFEENLSNRVKQNEEIIANLKKAGATQQEDGSYTDMSGNAISEEEITAATIALSEYGIVLGDTESTQERIVTLSAENNSYVKIMSSLYEKALSAMVKSSSKTAIQQKQIQKNVAALSNTFSALSASAKAVSSTIGSGLSKEAKKALGAIESICDTTANAINSIAKLGKDSISSIKSVTKGVEVGAQAAGESLSAMEKASVILTIISVALEIAMKIVDVIKQFTASAKMQDAIDRYTMRVDDLVFAQNQLQNALKSDVGVRYYTNLSKAAMQYDEIIKESYNAMMEAQRLYNYQKSRYSEDSDKVQDAKKQYQDLRNEYQGYLDDQKDMYQQMMEELSGTSLSSFSENLADAIIEGFSQGAEGINKVWEKTLDDLLKQMMRQQLATQIATMFEDVFSQLNNYTKDGDLTQSEMDAIIAQFEAKTEEAKDLANQYYNVMSESGLLEDEDTQASQGFGQMTQDQADTLTARFTALQIEGANVVSATQQIVADMAGISANAADIASKASHISDMADINYTILVEQLDQLNAIRENTALLSGMETRLQAIEQNTARL